jgi:hypothetical protein
VSPASVVGNLSIDKGLTSSSRTVCPAFVLPTEKHTPGDVQAVFVFQGTGVKLASHFLRLELNDAAGKV